MLLVLALTASSPAAFGAPDGSSDAPGVTVSLNGLVVLHRTPVPYPAALRERGIEGAVAVEVTLDAKAEVGDARVLSGPEELRRTVLESVLQWHFAQDAANATRPIEIEFQLPAGTKPAAPDFNPAVVVLGSAPAGPIGLPIKEITMQGIPDAAQAELRNRLPVRPGDVLTRDLANATVQAAKEFDEHLRVGFIGAGVGAVTVQILIPDYGPDLSLPPPSPARAPSGRIRVAPGFEQAKLKSSLPPQYPALALQARIQGVVKLDASIGKDGTIQDLKVISGHPLLAPAAIEAVRHWQYEATTLNGTPVEVESEIDINFALPANQ